MALATDDEVESEVDWIRVSEIADLCGFTTGTIYRALRAGRFPVPARKISGQWRIRRADVHRLVGLDGQEEADG